MAGERRVHVELTACEPVTVRGDRHRLRQLLLNLTENAIKYNETDGEMSMELRRNNGSAKLVIANSGPGIPAENLGRVFERFYRGDPAHSGTVDGSGLGLSIAQGIVRAHGGTIRLASEPGKNTSVCVTLPVAP